MRKQHPHQKWLQNVSVRIGALLNPSLLNPPLLNPALLRKSGHSTLRTLDPMRRKKDDKGVLNFKSTFTSCGWLEFLGIEPKYYPNLVRVFYNNASFQYEPNKNNIIEINTHVMGNDIYISLETIALDVDNQAVNEDDDEDEDDYDDDDDDDDDNDDDDPNKYIVSATPPARKLVIFYVNGVFAYIPRHPEGFNSVNLHNMDRVLNKLRSFSDHFLFVWDQRKCKTIDKFTYCKDLNDVWNEFTDFNVLNTLLVDDSPRKMIHNPINNYICPHSFDAASHSDDDALKKGGNIREYLENLLKVPNVLDFVSDNPFPSD
ncbi:hypothetical protein F3Y22_tig00111708pilonHSYRG00494 [Hibiscus syriacus]|uniref:FCP1 homology domain-containing protein n=1 Tax=Hibiscus syriacus TaxID=106335 RepID=A0A6A2Y331_HIBSY|nr:hypothetical protein F3Y22_tig00111708pilonHSYRG00494 [Hibiscus syriacus]